MGYNRIIMKRLRPFHAILLVLAFAGTVLLADYTMEGGFSHSGFERVSPDGQGLVVIDVGDLAPRSARFYRFLNSGNQEVKFFVGRDAEEHVQVAFDANEICYKTKRGYTHQGDWMICNKCDKSFRLTEVNDGGGGCKPVPVVHRLDGDRLILTESDILAGWRYFR